MVSGDSFIEVGLAGPAKKRNRPKTKIRNFKTNAYNNIYVSWKTYLSKLDQKTYPHLLPEPEAPEPQYFPPQVYIFCKKDKFCSGNLIRLISIFIGRRRSVQATYPSCS